MEITIDKDSHDQRFDRFLRKYFKPFPEIKLTDIYSQIRKKRIRVNERKVAENYRLQEGDVVEFRDIDKNNNIARWKQTKQEKINNLELKMVEEMLVFENDNWIVFDKPAGTLMHGGTKNNNVLTMNDYVEKYLDKLVSRTFKPSFAYRLDKDTSWVLIAAKTYESLQYINQVIRDRKIDKEYFVIVEGKPIKHWVIEKPLKKIYNKKFDRSQMIVDREGLESKTEFWTERTINHHVLGVISLLRVKIYTGRMHQIRVHLADLWHGVLWDIIYGNPTLNRMMYKKLKVNRQLLHCSQYSFEDINGKRLNFKTNLPFDFNNLLNN